MIELVRLTAKDAMVYWPIVNDLIESALKRTDGEYSVKHYKEYINSQYWDLWIAINTHTKEIQGAAVTEVIEYPNFNELVMKLVTGKDFNTFLLDTEQQFQDFAKENNCKRLTLYGRKGWLRILNKIGWTKGYTVMTKLIEKGE